MCRPVFGLLYQWSGPRRFRIAQYIRYVPVLGVSTAPRHNLRGWEEGKGTTQNHRGQGGGHPNAGRYKKNWAEKRNRRGTRVWPRAILPNIHKSVTIYIWSHPHAPTTRTDRTKPPFGEIPKYFFGAPPMVQVDRRQRGICRIAYRISRAPSVSPAGPFFAPFPSLMRRYSIKFVFVVN